MVLPSGQPNEPRHLLSPLYTLYSANYALLTVPEHFFSTWLRRL